MRRRRSNVDVCGTPYTVLVRYYGSDASVSLVTYIVCLHGWVTEKYELWSLNAQGVCEVHPFSRVRLFEDFMEDNFWTTLYNLRRCCIPFIGRRSLNGSVQFIRFTDVTSDSTSDIISTRNIFVHEWCNYPPMIQLHPEIGCSCIMQ